MLPVDDLVVVNEEEALTHLLHHLFDLTKAKLDIYVTEEPRQVVLTEVEHKIESCFVPTVLPADLDEVDNVLVVQQLQDPYLPQSSDREAFFFVFHQHFL